jgi:hypothetical protein
MGDPFLEEIGLGQWLLSTSSSPLPIEKSRLSLSREPLISHCLEVVADPATL